MKKILIIAAVFISLGAKGQSTPCGNMLFPTIDSLRSYVNVYIRNSAVNAFTNLRLNTAMIGITQYLDCIRNNGIDSISTHDASGSNPDTLKVYRKGVFAFYKLLPANGGGGGGTDNLNVGAGFKIIKEGTQEAKTLIPGFGMDLDSSATAITIINDTAAQSKTVLMDSTGIEFRYAPPAVAGQDDTLVIYSTGAGTGDLTGDGADTRIPYYTAAKVFSNSNNLKWNYSTKTLTLDSNTFTKNKITMLGDPTTTAPTMIEFRRNLNAPYSMRGQVGLLGGVEFNTTVNMDYTDNTHKYFDSTQAAIWTYLHNTIGWGIQWTKGGHTNNDSMWTYWGRVPYSIDILPKGDGEALTGGSRVNLNTIRFYDYANEGDNITLNLSGKELTFQGNANLTRTVLKNTENNGNGNQLLFVKQKTASFNLDNNTKVMSLDGNTVAQYGMITNGTLTGSISLLNHYWNVTNTAGSTFEAMRIDEDGYLGIGTNAPSKILHINSTVSGALLPRMNTTQMNAIGSPLAGELLFNTDTASYFQYTGSAWQNLRGAGGSGGSSYTFNSGLTESGGVVRWKGTLAESAAITQAGFDISFDRQLLIGTTTAESSASKFELYNSGSNTTTYIRNVGNDANSNIISFRKTVGGGTPYTITVGNSVGGFDWNTVSGFRGVSAGITTSNISLVDVAFSATNSAGTNRDIMKMMAESGQMRLGTPGTEISSSSLLELWNPSAGTQLAFQNTQANTNYNRIYNIKNQGGDFDAMASGDKAFGIETNTLVGYDQRFNANATGGFRALDHVFWGTNSSGTTADRFTITGAGAALYAADYSAQFTTDRHIPDVGWINTNKANIASPTFTGTPAAPTASAGTNTTQIATTAFVTNALSLITSGLYTSTLTNGTNVSSSTASAGQYMRVGNVVTYSFRVEVTSTGAGATEIGLSVPVATDFSANGDAAAAAMSATSHIGGVVIADGTNDRLSLQFTAPSGGSLTFYCTVTYKIATP